MNKTDKVKLILDTDIGCDCDDAGAMAILHRLADEGQCEIVAVTHCTSRRSGVQTIDAINRYYGRETVPVGICAEKNFLADEACEKFAAEVARRFPNRFSADEPIEDAVCLLRRTLGAAENGSITLVAIGPLNNLSALIRSVADEFSPLTGAELVQEKVAATVIMGGQFEAPGSEFNIAQDAAAAQAVSALWSGPLVYVPFEAGLAVKTGARLMREADNKNPVRLSYELYCSGARESWDLLAVDYAITGLGDFYTLSECGRVTFDDAGGSFWEAMPNGRDRILRLNGDILALTERLDEWMLKKQ